jgi:hypothetical protein
MIFIISWDHYYHKENMGISLQPRDTTAHKNRHTFEFGLE